MNVSEKKKLILTIMLLVVLTGCSGETNFESVSNGVTESSMDNSALITKFNNDLNNASKITIKKRITFLSPEYDIYLDGQNAYTIEGRITGGIKSQKLTIYDMNRNPVINEQQVKRSYNLNLNRYAELSNGGIIGEEQLNDMLTPYHLFHMYDKNGNEIAHTKKELVSIGVDSSVYDTNAEKIYNVEGEFSLVTPTYTLTKLKESNVDWEYIVFYTVIIDAIYSAE